MLGFIREKKRIRTGEMAKSVSEDGIMADNTC